MKIDRTSPTIAAPTSPAPAAPVLAAPAPPANWGSGAPRPAGDAFSVVSPGSQAPVDTARRALAAHALTAVSQTLAQGSAGPTQPLIERFGQALGLGLGVIVTEALSLVPSWNTPVLDAQGRPATHIEGADRRGDHALLKRHQEVVGPKIEALVKTLAPGMVRELLEGLGRGATAAPGVSYRLESAVQDLVGQR